MELADLCPPHPMNFLMNERTALPIAGKDERATRQTGQEIRHLNHYAEKLYPPDLEQHEMKQF
jgi:hypothetical protein